MTDKSAEHARLVEAIVEGTSIEPGPASIEDPALAQLHVLLEIARVHREGLAVDGPTGATVGAVPPVSLGHSGSRWAHLYLFESIGQGASGLVYRAWDSRLAREVALKLIPGGEPSTSSTLVEARRLARVSHPHVVSVYGADQVDGQVGVWMELLKGRTFHELVRTQGPFSAREAALIGADVCAALAAVHGAGLLHRDVKPQNVVREHGGRIVLMDLGAGREIGDETSLDLAGTPLYMAPELFTGASATVRTDVYSLGVLLFFLTTGSVPLTGGTLADIRSAHAAGRMRALRDIRPDLPRAFVEVVDRALAPDPARRFASAGEMERSLSATVVAREADARDTDRRSLVGRALSWKLPVWATVLITAGAGLLVMLSGTLGSLSGRPAADAKPGTSTSVDSVVRPLSADQAKIARAFEELASSLASRGQWQQAAEQYAEAERIYRLNTSPDAPLVAAALAKLGWAQQHAGKLEAARGNYELALSKFDNFRVMALMETTLAALGSLHQRAGRSDEAAAAIGRALAMRRRVLMGVSDDSDGWRHTGVTAIRLMELMPRYALLDDADGDWLPDLLEAAVGLNPELRDSDGDGSPDGDEDVDSDGISNWLELGLTVDPTRIVAHYGTIDPEWVAFQQPDNRRFSGRPVATPDRPAWNVPSNGQSLYFCQLSNAQRVAAMTRGWRYTIRAELHEGLAVASVDLSPEGPRFDMDFYQDASAGVSVRLNTSIVPLTGTVTSISSGRRWALAELEYDPATRTAFLIVDGVRRTLDPYTGHKQFQDGLGFFFGATNNIGNAPRGDVDFGLARLVIR